MSYIHFPSIHQILKFKPAILQLTRRNRNWGMIVQKGVTIKIVKANRSLDKIGLVGNESIDNRKGFARVIPAITHINH